MWSESENNLSHALWLQVLTGSCMQCFPARHVLLLSLTTTAVDTPPCPFWALLCSGPHIVSGTLHRHLHLYLFQKNPARRWTSSSCLVAVSLLSLQTVVVQTSLRSPGCLLKPTPHSFHLWEDTSGPVFTKTFILTLGVLQNRTKSFLKVFTKPLRPIFTYENSELLN